MVLDETDELERMLISQMNSGATGVSARSFMTSSIAIFFFWLQSCDGLPLPCEFAIACHPARLEKSRIPASSTMTAICHPFASPFFIADSLPAHRMQVALHGKSEDCRDLPVHAPAQHADAQHLPSIHRRPLQLVSVARYADTKQKRGACRLTVESTGVNCTPVPRPPRR